MAIKMTRGTGNVFADLGFPAAEAANLQLRSTLMIQLRKRLTARGAAVRKYSYHHVSGVRSAVAAVLSCFLATTATASRNVLSAQDTLTVSEQAMCVRCRIELSLERRLGEIDGDGILEGEPSSVSRDPQGRWIVTQFTPAGRAPLVFDAAGRFLQLLGKVGSGPGEFRSPLYTRVVGDSIFVTDRGNSRLTVVGPTGAMVRERTNLMLGMAYPFEVLRGGRVVVGVDVPTRDAVGMPLHLFSQTGTYLKSFGAAAAGAVRPGTAIQRRRRIARSADGGLWVTGVVDYTIAHYDSSGRLTTVLRRNPAWFARVDEAAQARGEPRPMIMGIEEDQEGRLWILGVTADARWKSVLSFDLPARMGGGRSALPLPSDPRKYHDAIIEVIDPRSRRLVVSQRFDEEIGFLVGTSHVANLVEAATGDFYIQTWRLELRETPH